MSTVHASPRANGLFEDEHDAYRESVRTHFVRTALPAAERWDHDGFVPDGAIRKAAEHGFVATAVPEEHGGLGIDDPRFEVIAVEEAASAGLPALALVLAAHGDVPPRALAGAGVTEAGPWLAGIADGTLRATTALHAGLRLRSDGRVDGCAPAVVGAAHADLFVVLVPGPDPVVGVVERDGAGVSVQASAAPVGLRACGFGELLLDAADFTPLEGCDVQDLLVGERLVLAGIAAAAGRAALDVTVAYVADRRAFGTPIASFQNTTQVLGRLVAALRSVQALFDRALADRVAGTLTAADAAAAKLLAAEVLGDVVDAGVQLHGGYGYMLEYPISHLFADGRFLRLHGGTTQDLRDEVAAALLSSR